MAGTNQCKLQIKHIYGEGIIRERREKKCDSFISFGCVASPSPSGICFSFLGFFSLSLSHTISAQEETTEETLVLVLLALPLTVHDQ